MSLPWLVADIGGTNARFGLVTDRVARPEAVAVLAVPITMAFPEAVAAYLAEHAGGVRPGAACVAIAGPVEGDRYRLTNADWSGSVRDLGIPNAVAAQRLRGAGGLPAAPAGDGDLVSLGGPEPSHGVKAVLGPGTGLGVAGLVPAGGGLGAGPRRGRPRDDAGRWTSGTTRSSGPCARTALEPRGGRAPAVGPGTVPAAPRARAGPRRRTRRACPPRRSCARMDDSLCAETVEVFCGMLGTFAGNVALTLGARGGVYLGGGVLPRIVDRVLSSDFRRRFEATPDVGRLPVRHLHGA